jgi:lipoprotein LprG
MKSSLRFVAPLVLASALVACGGETPASTLPPEPTLVLEAAATAMGSIDSVRFKIERSGAPIYIDPLDTLNFSVAEGQFAAPSSASALVTLAVGSLNAQIGAIAIDGTTWLSNPITGAWEDAPEGYDFDPATLFDPELGWRPLLASGLSDVEWIGEESTGGGARYHIRAQADEERVALILAGLIRRQPVEIDMWIDPETGYVREAELSTVFEGQTSDWFIDFTEFGEPVDITPPDTEG